MVDAEVLYDDNETEDEKQQKETPQSVANDWLSFLYYIGRGDYNKINELLNIEWSIVKLIYEYEQRNKQSAEYWQQARFNIGIGKSI